MINNWDEMSKFWHSMNGCNPLGAPDKKKTELARDLCLGLFMEVSELTDSFQWKPWRKHIKIDRENVKREVVDCIFFLHHIADCFGIDATDLQATYVQVMANNRKRYIEGDFSEEKETIPTSEIKALEYKLDAIWQKLNGDDLK